MTTNSRSSQVTALQSLTAIALTLPGMNLAQAETQITKPQVSFQYLNYDEQGTRYDANVYQALIEIPLGSRTDLAVKAARDAISGGSPIGYWAKSIVDNNPASVSELVAVNTSGATIKDHRNALDINLRYFADDVTVGIAGNLSEEQDYTSCGGGIKFTKDFNNKNTEVSIGYHLLNDHVRPTAQASAFKSERILREHKVSQTGSFSIEQTLTDKSYLTQIFEYSYDHGYLSDPYKLVYSYGDARPYFPDTINLIQASIPLPGAPGNATHSLFKERRPDKKLSFVAHTKFVQYIAKFDSSIRFGYRFARNDWKIKSHTFKVDYIQPFCEDYEALAGLRYYTQGKAKFYAMAFTVEPTAPFDAMPLGKYASSDYRLAKFGDITYEAGLSKKFMKDKQGKVSLIGGIIDRRNKYYWGHQDKTQNPSNNFKSYYVSVQFNFVLG